MKIYISIPITGTDIEVTKTRADSIKAMLMPYFEKVITPFDVCSELNKPYSYYIGLDIEALLECDAIYMATGWEKSKGCNLEYQAANIYKKQIILEARKEAAR